MSFRNFVLTLVLLLGGAVYFFGFRPRVRAASDLAAGTGQLLRLNVTIARRQAAADQVVLPGTLRAYADTAIRARTSGYVAKWLVDLGDQVTRGQALAIIDSPEVDQQLNQARAKLEQARANAELARITTERWKSLALQQAVSQQDADQKAADHAARRADVDAAQAEVERLEQFKGFETVAAPFDGVISARNIDVGNLVEAGSGAELFHLTQSDVLRAFVSVPQRYVAGITAGLPVEVEVTEFPHERFLGKITRFAGAMDAASNTLQVEADIPNPARRLLAGMFCEVRLRPSQTQAPILIPSNTAIIRADGTLVALVTAGHTIHLQVVRLGRDFGTQLEVLDGLPEDSRVVENPPDSLREGQNVEPVAAGAGGAP